MVNPRHRVSLSLSPTARSWLSGPHPECWSGYTDRDPLDVYVKIIVEVIATEPQLKSRSASNSKSIFIAISLHNFPEGMAVGVGAASGNFNTGAALTVGIGVQNIPEGLAVAAALMAAGYPRHQSAGIAFLTGLVEPVGDLLGSSLA